jgi:adenosylcobinamide-phosphate synthase
MAAKSSAQAVFRTTGQRVSVSRRAKVLGQRVSVARRAKVLGQRVSVARRAKVLGQRAPGRLAARFVGASVGLLADRVLGEPPEWVHPVALFGRAMEKLERCCWADAKGRGIVYALLGAAQGYFAGLLLESLLDSAGPSLLGSMISTATAVWLCSAGRSLSFHAKKVSAALGESDLRESNLWESDLGESNLGTGDLQEARSRLSMMVSRDVMGLDPGGVARATVESVAENANDAVVAPALYGALLGARGALLHRALNTMDAMVGYRSPRYERFGWAAARLDDAAGWLPSRLTAALVMALVPGRAKEISRAWRQDAPGHPSPNGGVAEAGFAGALGVQLGGVNIYEGRLELRRVIGRGDPPQAGDIKRALLLLDAVVLGLSLALALGGLTMGGLGTRRSAPKAFASRERGICASRKAERVVALVVASGDAK